MSERGVLLNAKNCASGPEIGLASPWQSAAAAMLASHHVPASCRGRLKVVVTKIPSFQLTYIDDFATKDELIDACMASAHIPFFLDWRATAKYRCNLQPAPLRMASFPGSKSMHASTCMR